MNAAQCRYSTCQHTSTTEFRSAALDSDTPESGEDSSCRGPWELRCNFDNNYLTQKRLVKLQCILQSQGKAAQQRVAVGYCYQPIESRIPVTSAGEDCCSRMPKSVLNNPQSWTLNIAHSLHVLPNLNHRQTGGLNLQAGTTKLSCSAPMSRNNTGV